MHLSNKFPFSQSPHAGLSLALPSPEHPRISILSHLQLIRESTNGHEQRHAKHISTQWRPCSMSRCLGNRSTASLTTNLRNSRIQSAGMAGQLRCYASKLDEKNSLTLNRFQYPRARSAICVPAIFGLIWVSLALIIISLSITLFSQQPKQK